RMILFSSPRRLAGEAALARHRRNAAGDGPTDVTATIADVQVLMRDAECGCQRECLRDGCGVLQREDVEVRRARHRCEPTHVEAEIVVRVGVVQQAAWPGCDGERHVRSAFYVNCF